LYFRRFRAIISFEGPVIAQKSLKIIFSGERMSAFQDTVSQFLEELSGAKSPNTVRAYNRALADFTSWYTSTVQGDFSIGDVVAIDVREYRRYLLNRKLSTATVNQRLSALKSLFRWARHRGLVESNPTEVVNGVKKPKLAPKWLSKGEERKLLRVVQRSGDKRDVALITFMLNTGLRVGEIASLALGDVELGERKGTVHVRSGKGTKARTVPLNAETRRALREYLKERGEECKEAPLFLGQRGEPLGDNGVRYLVRKYSRHAGLEECTPHTLRHTFAKRLVDAGVSLEKVAALLGHEDLNTTRIYTVPSLDDLAGAVEKIG
jgi:site-specific recombinase XerD